MSLCYSIANAVYKSKMLERLKNIAFCLSRLFPFGALKHKKQ